MHLTKRQRQVYEYLKDHIQSLGYAPSIMEMAKEFGLSSSATVHKHLETLEKKGLIRKTDHLSRAIEVIEEPEVALAQEYPVLGHIVAGRPIEVLENREVVSLMPDAMDKNVFVLRVKGNSMIEDHILDGDYVIIEKRSTAENGEIVVALLDNDKATLKRYYREGRQIRLQPANSDMEPIIVKSGEFKIQGVVIGVMRKFK